jgi:5-methylcytosine-specific restriction enzyme A
MPQRPARYRPTPKRPTPSEASRPTAAQRGYGYRWQQARLSFLAAHPLCIDCSKQGRVTEATTIDHVIPHKGNEELFWDVSNWESCCASCHSIRTLKYDGGFGREVKPKDSN